MAAQQSSAERRGEGAPAPGPAGAHAGPGAGAGRRVRLAMFGVLALIALVLVVLAYRAFQSEVLRSADAEIIGLAGAQRLYSQRLSLLATQHARDAALEQLERGLADARTQAGQLERLIDAQVQRGAEDVRGMEATVRAWRDAREPFFEEVGRLVRARAAGDADAIASSLPVVQAQAPDYFAAAQALVEHAQRLGQVHNRQAQNELRVAIGAVMVLMLLLALAVAEPTARFVERQYAALQQRSDEVRKLALVAEHTANAVAILDAQARIEWINPGFRALTGFSDDEARGQQLGRLTRLGDSAPEELAHHRDKVARGEQVAGDMRIITKDGTPLWVSTDMQPLHDGQGRVTAWVLVASSIDESVRARQQRRALFEAMPTGVLVYAPDGSIVDCNSTALGMLGLPPGQPWTSDGVQQAIERLGRPVHDDMRDFLPEERPVPRSLREGLSSRGVRVGYLREGKEPFWGLFSTEPLRDDKGAIYGAVACVMDISAQIGLEQKLRENARTDSLTALPNRAVVTDKIEAALARHRAHPGYHFAVLFMDFDRFKQVNDTLGHGVGDALLRQIASRLQSSLRESDSFVRTSDFGQMAARIGGDEFVVLLDDIRGDLDAEVVAGRLLEQLAMPYVIGPHTVNSSVSIGIVTATHAVGDVDSILRDADIAMYEAKRTGRGRYVLFEPAMHRRVRDDVALENDLRRALAEDQLFVVYQPLVDLVSLQMTGMEALLRWRHPQRGLVSPVEFIPVAEAVGLIGKLGAFVLHTACADFAWLQSTLGDRAPQTVSVNLSRAQLHEASLAADVLDALRAHGMAAGQLQLEVTESLAAQDPVIQGRLHDVKALGVTLALDDFGTGYSSLSCLHELPIDVVKIDRSFVSLAHDSDYHRVLIEATVLMARTLGMGTLAEGIETAPQATLMRNLGCGKGQGYLFSAPLVRDALHEWIEKQQQQAAAG